jgi:hypothetical protein
MSAWRLDHALASGALAALALTFGLGNECDPKTDDDLSLYRMTGAPPTRTAQVREADDSAGRSPTITLSRGVVLSVRCWDTCDYTCDTPTFTVAHPELLSVRAVDRLNANVPEYALVAAQSGTTQLTIATDCKSKTYSVTITEH